MKRFLYIIAALSVCALISSCGGGSPVGAYYSDMDGGCTIVLRSNGSAAITSVSGTYDTYWDYAGKGIDVSIHTEVGTRYWMDFDEKRIYFGADDYRSCKNGYAFRKQ